jgi:hypothetical protein
VAPESERLRRLEVDDQLELGRLLHRQVGWLLAFEDAVYVAGGETARELTARNQGSWA